MARQRDTDRFGRNFTRFGGDLIRSVKISSNMVRSLSDLARSELWKKWWQGIRGWTTTRNGGLVGVFYLFIFYRINMRLFYWNKAKKHYELQKVKPHEKHLQSQTKRSSTSSLSCQGMCNNISTSLSMTNKFYLSRRRKPPLELILIGLNALHPPLIITLWLWILMTLA